jgi:hypothetical protein
MKVLLHWRQQLAEARLTQLLELELRMMMMSFLLLQESEQADNQSESRAHF